MQSLLRIKDRVIIGVFKFLTLNFIFPRVYKKARRQPVDNSKVVFVEIRLPEITNSFRVMFDEVLNNYDYRVSCHFLLNTLTRRRIYMRRACDMLRDIATAKVVFLNEASNCIGSIKLRPETEVVQLWHGCGAFKKFGLSTADLIFGDSRKQVLRHPYYKNQTMVTISSPEVDWAYSEAMNIPLNSGIISATGVSRSDVFYKKEFIEAARARFYELMPQAKGKKVILYAPTFRGRVSRARAPRSLKVDMFKDAFGDDYVLLCKHHPFVMNLPPIPAQYQDFARDVTKTMDIEDLLCIADICITDYSSLVFEYSLFERPIIFFAYDLDEYFDWRGFYYDYFEMSPGPICTTNLEMIEYIKQTEKEFDKTRVQEFRHKFMRSCDGRATGRILEKALGEESLQKHKKAEPLNEQFHKAVQFNPGKYFGDYVEKVALYKAEKAEAGKLYKKYVSGNTPKGAVTLNLSGETARLIKRSAKGVPELKYKIGKKDSGLEAVVKALASAEYIIIDKDAPLLNMLDIRAETKVVRLPSFAFPLRKSGKASRKYKSGLNYELEEVAPKAKKIDIVPTADKSLAEIYAETYGADKDGILPVGSPKTDLLFSEEYKKRALKKFYKLHPECEGKKILLSFIGSRHLPENDAIEAEAEYISYLFEYLKDDFCFIKHAPRFADESAEVRFERRLGGQVFDIDITRELTVYESLAIADTAIGAYEDAVFTYALTGNPLYIYAPGLKARLRDIETNFDYESVAFAPVFGDPKTLAQTIARERKEGSYDYAKYNAFKKKYLKSCDGKATRRLLKEIGII